MATTKKKLKAAITGVLYFLMEQESEEKPANQWSKLSRETIMKNREWLQRRCRTITFGRYR